MTPSGGTSLTAFQLDQSTTGTRPKKFAATYVSTAPSQMPGSTDQPPAGSYLNSSWSDRPWRVAAAIHIAGGRRESRWIGLPAYTRRRLIRRCHRSDFYHIRRQYSTAPPTSNLDQQENLNPHQRAHPSTTSRPPITPYGTPPAK